MRYKKGDVSDGIVFVIVLFFLAVAFIVVALANDKFIDVIQDTALNDSDASTAILGGLNTLSSTGIQNAFVFIFAGLVLGMMLSSFLVRVHPAWFFLYLLFAGISVFLAILIANAYNSVATSEALSSIATQQTMIGWIMRNIIKITIGAIALSVLILFAKPPEVNSPV